MTKANTPSWADERLAAAFLAWWGKESVELDDDVTDEQAALDDFKSLARHLHAQGYEVVRRG